MARFRLAALLILGAPVFGSTAHATTIDWNHSWVYASGLENATTHQVALGVTLVGKASGVADTTHHVVIHLADSSNQPLASVRVLFYGDDDPARRVCDEQLSATSLGCSSGHARVYVDTDASGNAQMAIMGGSNGDGDGQTEHANQDHTSGQLQFYDAQSNLLETKDVPVAVLDLDGGGGMRSSDLYFVYDDIFNQNLWRCDYDFNGTVNASDFSFWYATFFHGGSDQSCGSTYCP